QDADTRPGRNLRRLQPAAPAQVPVGLTGTAPPGAAVLEHGAGRRGTAARAGHAGPDCPSGAGRRPHRPAGLVRAGRTALWTGVRGYVKLLLVNEVRVTVAVACVLRVFLDDVGAPRYGYELMRLTGYPSGKLYPILARLEAAGWLDAQFEDIDPKV